MTANGKIDRFVPVVHQTVNCYVSPKSGIEFNLNSQPGDPLNLFFKNIRWKPVVRNSYPEHPPCYGKGLKNCNLETILCQKICRSQTSRTGANDGNLFIPGRYFRKRQFVNINLICRKALKGADGNSFIHFLAATGFFTGMGAYSANHTRQGQGPCDYLKSLLIFLLGNHGHVAVGINVVRTSISARRTIQFVYGISSRYRLWVQLINSFPVTKTFIVETWKSDRANFCTITTSRAFVKIYISGNFIYSYIKVALFSGYLFNLR